MRDNIRVRANAPQYGVTHPRLHQGRSFISENSSSAQSANSSKVNDFNHRMAEERRERDKSPTGEGGAPQEKLSSIALFSDVDVASICESAIQSVCVGK